MIIKPNFSNAPAYSHRYIDLVEGNDLCAELKNSFQMTKELFLSLPTDKINYSYSENKWTVKEVLRHIIDCERIYAYRIFRLSRMDNTPLNSFDENEYINNISKLDYSLLDLLEEFELLRNSTLKLFQPITIEMLDFEGTVNNALFTPRLLGYLVVGHNIHHCNMIKTRYL